MNYNDIVRIRYPNYILTHIGTGDDYYALEWSIFNPEPNPIPKATLDADIADAIATGLTGAIGDLTPYQEEDVAAIALVSEGSGLIRKIAHATYTLDTNTYLTSITDPMITAALGYIPYDSANPSNYTTKSYVDNVAGAGVIWQTPIHAFNFVGTAIEPPTIKNENENYIISAGGNIGEWASFSPGDRVSWINNQWVLREVTTISCRLGVCFDRTTTPVGDAAGKQDYIGEIVGGDAINGWVWMWTAPQNNYAVFNNLPASAKFGQSYTYVASQSKWIAFSSNMIGDGDGLSFSGNTLNINAGRGITLLSDKVSVDLHPTGGIITSLDGTTPSSDPNAGLALETIGIPGTYTKITVDVYGRIVSGSSPTTISGYGITDGLTTAMLGSPLGVATLDVNAKLPTSQLPTHNQAWSTITSTPNTLTGYGIIDAQEILISGTNIKTINSTSLLGSGNIDVQSVLVSGTNIKTVNSTSILGAGDIEVQPTLISGTNIKTVNNTTLLGSGNISVQPTLVSGTNIKTINSNSLLGSGDILVQDVLVSGTSIKTINSTSLLGSGDVTVQPTLVSGTNIKTINGTSLLGSGDVTVQPTLVSGTNIKTVAGYSVVGSGDQPLVLNDLTDVLITTPVYGQSIFYDGVQWINVGDTGGSNGGTILKRVWSGNVPASTGTTVITPGTTAPTATQGTQLWTYTLTPISTLTTYVIQSSIVAAGTVNNSYITLALFRNNVYIGGSLQIIQSTNNSATLSFLVTDSPSTTSPVTYQVRIGVSTGTWYANRRPTEVTYGGTQTGWIISEY